MSYDENESRDTKAEADNLAFEAWWEAQGLDGEQVKARDIDRWTLAKMAFDAGSERSPAPQREVASKDERVLRIQFNEDNGVDVTGFLQFTKAELEDMGFALAAIAAKRPGDYRPLYVMEKP